MWLAVTASLKTDELSILSGYSWCRLSATQCEASLGKLGVKRDAEELKCYLRTVVFK